MTDEQEVTPNQAWLTEKPARLWLNVFKSPGREGIPRLKIDLEINGEDGPTKKIVDTYDVEDEIICQSHNLTCLFEFHDNEIDQLKGELQQERERSQKLVEALEEIAKETHTPYARIASEALKAHKADQ